MTVQTGSFEKRGTRPSRAGAPPVEQVVADGFDVTTFIENFEVLTEAEGGVGHLRQLVLNLAVVGSLTGHAGFRFQPENEVAPQGLPPDWRWCSLAACAAVSDGPFGSKLKKSHYVDAPGYRVVRLGNVGLGRFKDDDQVFIGKGHYDSLSACQLQEDDILVASLGNPPGRACLVPGSVLPAINKADCFRVRLSSSKLLPAYFVVALNSPAVLSRALGLHRGDTRGRITLDHLRTAPLPIPPLPEQKRVVAKVDELMRLLDDLEAKQAKKRETQARARTAALGALTSAEGPEEFEAAWKRVAGNFETLFDGRDAVADLRQLILNLAVVGVLTGHVGFRFQAEADATPPGLPPDWRWCSLQSCASVSDGPFGSKLKKSHYVNRPDYRVVRLGNVGLGRFKDDDRVFIDKGHYDSLSACHLEADDVLVASLGNPPGRACLVPETVLPAINKADCFRVRLSSAKLLPAYFVLALNSPAALSRALDLHRGDTRGRITLEHLRTAPLPIPPLAEQKRIVAKVEQLIKLCGDLESKLLRQETTAAKLVAAVVAEMVGS